jgi:hypothetical protein
MSRRLVETRGSGAVGRVAVDAPGNNFGDAAGTVQLAHPHNGGQQLRSLA